MSLNETAYPPLPGILRAVAETAAESHHALDALSTGLTGALADHLAVPAGDIHVGPGSGALLQQLFCAFTDSTTEAVHAWPSWEAYPALADNAGASTVRVPLDEEATHDLEAIAKSVTDRTGLVLICNPNNPTGTTVGHEDMRRFLDLLPRHVTVLIDEAYRDFADAESVADGIELYRDDERVCVVRTFSTSYGLLGLRVGYLVGHERVLAPLRGLREFYRVGNTAQAAAIAALAEQPEIRRRCSTTAAERERLASILREQGWRVAPSQANFLWLPLDSPPGTPAPEAPPDAHGSHEPHDARDSRHAQSARDVGEGREASGARHGQNPDWVPAFTRFCADRGVLVCGKPGEGVRVTVADRAGNDAFAALAAQFPGTAGCS